MANLFKSTLIFLVAVVFVAEAHSNCKSDKDVDVSVSISAETKGSGSHSVGHPVHKVLLAKKSSAPDVQLDDQKCLEKVEGFHFDKAKFHEFLNKIHCLFHVYTSKQLVPELKDLVAKTAGFIIEQIAKQKPKEMCKINKVMQKTAKVCEDAYQDNKCETKC